MAKTTQELELLVTSKLEGVQKDLDDLMARMTKLTEKQEKAKSGWDVFKKAAAYIGATTLAMQGLNYAFTEFLSHETALADFSALTGVTGAALDNIGKKAEVLS